MSDDLVEKLRRRAKQNRTPGGLLVMIDPGTLNEAADEIERLRALVAEWEAVWAMVMPTDEMACKICGGAGCKICGVRV